MDKLKTAFWTMVHGYPVLMAFCMMGSMVGGAWHHKYGVFPASTGMDFWDSVLLWSWLVCVMLSGIRATWMMDHGTFRDH